MSNGKCFTKMSSLSKCSFRSSRVNTFALIIYSHKSNSVHEKFGSLFLFNKRFSIPHENICDHCTFKNNKKHMLVQDKCWMYSDWRITISQEVWITARPILTRLFPLFHLQIEFILNIQHALSAPFCPLSSTLSLDKQYEEREWLCWSQYKERENQSHIHIYIYIYLFIVFSKVHSMFQGMGKLTNTSLKKERDIVKIYILILLNQLLFKLMVQMIGI